MRSVPSQGYKTLKDLAKILSFFNYLQIEERGIAEISKALGMHPSKVSRMLGTLESDGFFEKDLSTGKYRLGVRFLELGMAYVSNFPLRKIIRPHIEQMAKELNLTASWALFRNDRVIVVDRVQNLNIDILTHSMGLNVPVHSTSVGKVLLAYFPEEEQDRVLRSVKLIKFTEKTIIDQSLIKERLRLTKERGYATDECETYEYINCIAAPIKNFSGDVVAAINLMDEESRTGREKLFQFCGYLKEKAFFISRQIGYRSNFA